MARLSVAELDRFTVELRALVASAVPLPEGLRQLSKEMGTKRFQEFCHAVARGLESGKTLSDAVAQAPQQVPRSFQAMLQCVDLSGGARESLEYAVVQGRLLRQHRTSILSSIAYPMLTIAAAILLLLFLSRSVMPQFVQIYVQLGAELPWMTQQVLDCLRPFGTSWGLLAGLLTSLAIVLVMIVPNWRDAFLRLLDTIPVFSKVVTLSDATLFSKFLGSMLKGGVPLPTALQAASLLVSRASTRKALENMAAASEKGMETAPALPPSMPATAAWMYVEGEKKGTLAQSCDGIAQYCEERFQFISRQNATLFEPFAILLIAFFLGIMIIAFYLPFFSIPRLVK